MPRLALRPLVLIAVLALMAVIVGAQAPVAQTDDQETAKVVVDLLERGHMARPVINDKIAVKWCDNFIKDLDPRYLHERLASPIRAIELAKSHRLRMIKYYAVAPKHMSRAREHRCSYSRPPVGRRDSYGCLSLCPERLRLPGAANASITPARTRTRRIEIIAVWASKEGCAPTTKMPRLSPDILIANEVTFPVLGLVC